MIETINGRRIGKVSEWAETRGFTRQNAYKNMKRHDIPWHDEARHLIDLDTADEIWDRSVNPAKQRGGVAGGEAAANRQPDLFSQTEDEDEPRAAPAGSNLAKAQLTHYLLKIRKERLTLDQMENKLVKLSDVREFETRVFEMVKQALLMIGPEIQADLAAETEAVKCGQMVTRRIERALTNFSTWNG